MKCPVAPESDIAYLTALVTLLLLNTIAACGVWVKLLARIMLVHAFALVGRFIDIGWISIVLCCVVSAALLIILGIFAAYTGLSVDLFNVMTVSSSVSYSLSLMLRRS